ncbi:MAG TPA: bifunctional diaminohydroxyphosphoribosylaminopyrimidine deaminase/5-amino-6-(5-phosphoribosylamino)uracil reductase RibD, partial [Chitinophagaceae bacterium]|nr:bifunctional diaminohydroxyphosphoribosylaminopyrimidine deaminase/5-amino-6-(5-phosphoribosylamino)uracil reductase RibD [Chitinophagaceae bacterium]
NCVRSVPPEKQELISRSVMYISLEPCAHYGKTPPCADMIIEKKIPEVVIGCRDPFKEVDGKGIEKLNKAGVKTLTGVLEADCRALNRRFFTFHAERRPYTILKWAQTADGRMANDSPERLLISNEYSNRLVHKWRSEEAAILTGTNTALLDNPSLTTRLWTGNNPVRLVVDMDGRLPASLKLFDGTVRTIVFNTLRHEEKNNLLYYQVTRDTSLIDQVNHALYTLHIQSVLVEGGARLLQSFFDAASWDEARVITNHTLYRPNGLPAPVPADVEETGSLTLQNDTLRFYKPSTR